MAELPCGEFSEFKVSGSEREGEMGIFCVSAGGTAADEDLGRQNHLQTEH